MAPDLSQKELLAEVEDLRQRLQEAEDTIEAIRTGQVDALIVKTDQGNQLYTLKTADQTYRVFIEQMREGAVTLDKNQIILYSNSQFASIIGLPLSQIVGMSFYEFVPEGSVDVFNKLVKKGWESSSKGEILLKKQDDEQISFLLSLTSLELDEGEALSIILTDLTEQKEAENQLKIKNEQLEESRLHASVLNKELEAIVKERSRDLFMSRQHFQFVADNIPVIVWTTQADGNADYFNKLWYEYTGLNFEQSKDRGSQQVLHPDDFESTAEAWDMAIREKNGFHFEYRIKRSADGQYRWFLGKGEPLKDEEGNVIAWFGISIDIDDQKKALEKKDEFISMASHELKTPLSSLKGYVQLIGRHENLPGPVSKYITKANESINKLQHLISNLLDVSKIEAGKLKFNTEVFNLADSINSCIEDCTHMYEAYNIKANIDPHLPVVGNAERLEQVLMNLISNAVKYSDGKKEIIVSGKKLDNRVVVSVTDFGLGLAEEDQQKVFERFYRVNTNNFSPGLGMGLYISSEIIKEHFGKIEINSKLKQGSTFSFSLPLINSRTS